MLSVIKIGGNIIDSPSVLSQFLQIFSRIEGAKILVHGGGKLATHLAQKLEIPVQMHDGRRITDAETLKIITMVYAGLINKNIVAELQSLGLQAFGLCGADLNLILATKRPLKNGIDYGFVGDVQTVNGKALFDFLSQNISPVIAPISHDGNGNLLNTNADTIASVIATSLAKLMPTNLIYCFEKKGVLSDPQDDNSVILEIDEAKYALLKQNGVVSAGMLPKLDNAFEALRQGLEQVVICQADALENFGKPNFVGTSIRLSNG